MNNIKKYNSKAALIFIAAFFFSQLLFSQNAGKKFFELSFYEKKWVVFHLLKAKKAQRISEEAKDVAKSLKSDTLLDNNPNGGQLDAFRHAYWMARLTQEIGWRSAYRLGIAHEKANYAYFKKNKTEDGTLPDEESGAMDFLNNDGGIEAGKRFPDASQEELVDVIVQMILEGKLYIIAKDSSGNFLDCSGNRIPIENIKGKWKTNKCVIPSNRKF